MHNQNVLKSGNIVKSENARVIDSNDLVAERLSFLSDIIANDNSYDYESEDEFASDGFVQGLNAEQVELLLSDEGEEGVTRIDDVNQGFDESQIQAMIDDANAQAQEIIQSASAEAENIINNANADAEAIRANAEKEGYENGYNSGQEEGLRIAEEARQQCALKEQELEELYSKKIEELEPLFVDKITDIYEQIFKVDLSDKKEIVFYLISDAMRGIEGGKNFLIHVSKEDYEYVNERKEELMQGLPNTSTIEVIEDFSLSNSECFIEAESGIFDCGLGTELSLLKKELTLLAYKKE